MKKQLKEMIEIFGTLLLMLLPILLVVSVIILDVIALAKYGSKPITEVPMWAYLFLRGGK